VRTIAIRVDDSSCVHDTGICHNSTGIDCEATNADREIVFTVPETHDMVSQLFSPSEPKNMSDILLLVILGFMVSGLYWLPSYVRIPVFGVTFLFWRACYNVGIGWLLQEQSKHRRLVIWAKKSGIFEAPESGKNPHPALYRLLKRELETKIPNDYKFETAPIDYNTWLVFRRVVDLILMCDFTSYCCFAIACARLPPGEGILMTVGRWIAGIALFMFNLWVKLDAHRVVKDYAWYWGDFFFLIDQELTFDGVFEMAPHPMYSVGYAGYYGISLMAASYKVLFISIIAHAAQFAFLTLVESPHIEKTYNSPPRKRMQPDKVREDPMDGDDSDSELHVQLASSVTGHSSTQPSLTHSLIGFQNIDLHRVTDFSNCVLQAYIVLFALLTPSNVLWQTIFTVNAILWRLWFNLGIGYILDRQSNKRSWTRHFIKYGDDTEEAWRQWKGLYYISMTMCYASFMAAAWKMYALPPDWTYGMALLRHVLGLALIALQLWTAISIHESLGEFGWFYGDFFWDHASKLTYGGIYRFLNNPERVLGLSGVWGVAVITWSKSIFAIAFLSHILTLCFIQFVERPHMQKLYGETVRRQSGLSKSIRRSLPPPLRRWQSSVDRGVERAADFIEEFIETAGAKLAEGAEHVVQDSKAMFKNYPARISITRLSEDLAGFDPKDYSLAIEGTLTSSLAELDRRSGREGEHGRKPARRTSDFRTLIFEYGTPVKVRWTAPLNHSKKDWVGLYMVSDNASREITRLSSRGRWVATNPGEYDSETADFGIVSSGLVVKDKEGKDCISGEMEFIGDKLWWTTGVFEFRYHHDSKHNVMAISLPFEVRIPRFDEDDVDTTVPVEKEIENALLPVIQNCFDQNPDISPQTADEGFGDIVERDGKYAKRVVFAVLQMFGVEFAPEVVLADGCVRNLSWRICNAKKALVSVAYPSRKDCLRDMLTN